MNTENPLLKPFDTPHQVAPFDQVKTEHYLPAINAAIERSRKEIEAIRDNDADPTFENTIVALEETGELVGRISSVLFNLNSAETSEELQKVAQEASPVLTQYGNEIKQDAKLFDRINTVYQSTPVGLNGEQKMLLEKSYKSFVRSGAGLSDEDKKRFAEVSVRLSELGLTFGENVLAERNAYEMHLTEESDIAGLPEDVVGRAREAAKAKELDGWIFTLQAPSYLPFMEYADSRERREELFKAYMSKAFKGDDQDNQAIVKELVSLRYEMASLLGYDSYAAYILEERMADSEKIVNKFLQELLEKAKPKALAEVEELKEYARKLGFEGELQRWDWAYYSEKLRKEKYDLDDELTKPYFKLENVINGVFTTAEKLYDLTFVENPDIPVYHDDVKAYEVFDKGELKAVFMADYFPRAGKRPGAWMTSYREQKNLNGNKQIPHISIVCNFTPSSDGQPSLLKFDEVKTLFHEFGHALHGMLADTTYGSLSGTSVSWDFVELPSQIFENWCFEKECLSLFAHHYETGELIPDEYIQRIKDSSTYHEAYATLRQLSFGMLDMTYHQLDSADKANIESVGDFEREAMSATETFPKVDNTNMSVQFAHIFAGGYAAGYYSYKWAEVLDADAFELFKENGVFDKDTAQSFKDNILSQGGTQKPMELYKKFSGREPSVDPLLRRSGLIDQ